MSLCTSSISDKKVFLLILVFKWSWLFPQSVDSSSVYKISSIEIAGNKKTKSRIITRELTRQLNDTISLSNFSQFKKRSEQNIFNTQLFIYDTIYSKMDHENKSIELRIAVKERWYIWPVPVLEVQDRNFNTWWQTKDLFRINYGLALGFDNFSGLKDKLVFLVQRGYTEKYGFSYRLPYINKAQTIGFNMLYVFARNNEVTYKTIDNLPLFTRQYRQYLLTEHEGKIGLIQRPNLYEQRTFELVIRNSAVLDTVVKLNSEYFGDERHSITYGSLQYRYTYDDRDNKVYPLTGWAMDAWIIQEGFNFSTASPVNYLNVTGSVRKHTQLQDRIFIANMVKGRIMNVDKISFNFNRALGWNDQIRGYEYYVLDGQRYFLSRNSLRYQIIKPKVYQNKSRLAIKQFSTIPYYAFFNIHCDVGYVEDRFYGKTNNLNNSWLYGYGAGIDFVTYYDFVLRLEYSFNRQKESGFFIHLTSGF